MTNYTIEQLEEMLSSENRFVRSEVAKQGYALDKLINDNSWVVRLEVVKFGYGLDKLINDEDKDVRLEIAKQGYGLDKLINDKSHAVRKEVAKQGYGLDVLINDNNDHVSSIANKVLKFKNHKVIAKNFGTYYGNLYLHYNNENDYLVVSGCYDSDNIDIWKLKCNERINLETAEKYSKLILKELNK